MIGLKKIIALACLCTTMTSSYADNGGSFVAGALTGGVLGAIASRPRREVIVTQETPVYVKSRKTSRRIVMLEEELAEAHDYIEKLESKNVQLRKRIKHLERELTLFSNPETSFAP